MNSITYIVENFLTLGQVAAFSGIGMDRLLAMQRAGCLPGPAYSLEGKGTVKSIFGLHKEDYSIELYPYSHMEKAHYIEQAAADLKATAKALKIAFKARYKDLLKEMNAAEYGLAHVFSADGNVAGEAAETLLETEWQHYLIGTYGLCTRSATVEEIATKEIMISKIKWLTEQLDTKKGEAKSMRRMLSEAVDLLDQVSAPFAPHERDLSSRGKYVDRVRQQYLA